MKKSEDAIFLETFNYRIIKSMRNSLKPDEKLILIGSIPIVVKKTNFNLFLDKVTDFIKRIHA